MLAECIRAMKRTLRDCGMYPLWEAGALCQSQVDSSRFPVFAGRSRVAWPANIDAIAGLLRCNLPFKLLQPSQYVIEFLRELGKDLVVLIGRGIGPLKVPLQRGEAVVQL